MYVAMLVMAGARTRRRWRWFSQGRPTRLRNRTTGSLMRAVIVAAITGVAAVGCGRASPPPQSAAERLLRELPVTDRAAIADELYDRAVQLQHAITDPRTQRQRTIGILRIIVVTRSEGGLYVPPSGPPRPPPRPRSQVELRDLVASSSARLPLEVRAALRTAPRTVIVGGRRYVVREQEAVFAGTGLHAEARLISYIRQGSLHETWYLLAGAASRNVCANPCASMIHQEGGQFVGRSEAGGETRKRRFVFSPR